MRVMDLKRSVRDNTSDPVEIAVAVLERGGYAVKDLSSSVGASGVVSISLGASGTVYEIQDGSSTVALLISKSKGEYMLLRSTMNLDVSVNGDDVEVSV